MVIQGNGHTKAYKWLLAVIVAALALLPSTPVSAIDDPDSMSVYYIHVNRHLLETNDMLVYGRYNIAYTSTPAVSIDQTFTFRLIDTDNVTELGSFLAYPYVTLGYGEGVFSFYFDNTTAPTWGQMYTIRLSGNPSQFEAPPQQDFAINTVDYTSSTTQADNQQELTNRVLTIAAALEIAWNTTLLDAEDVGMVLNGSGEIYFRNSIPGLQSMASGLYLVNISDPDYSAATWTNSFVTSTESRWSGTWVDDAISGLAGLMGGIDPMLATGSLVFTGCVVIAALYWKRFRTITPAYLDMAAIVVCMAGLAFFPFGLMGLLVYLAWVYIWWELLIKR